MINIRTSSHPYKGFTLIELLTVIAIIGILAAIIIPTVGGVITRANRASAANNVRQIATGYISFSTEGARSRSVPSTEATTQGWAAYIAQRGGPNEAVLYYVSGDPALAAGGGIEAQPTSILLGEGASRAVNPEWSNAPIGYTAVSGMPATAPGTTTPLIWTFGLGNDGTWADGSPWGTTGGHVGYLGGNVDWYGNTNVSGEEAFQTFGSNARTGNINDAIPGSATVTTTLGRGAGGGE